MPATPKTAGKTAPTSKDTHSQPGSAPLRVLGGGAGAESSAPEHCQAEACKGKAARFGFCGEHYEQFKFGLITKKGAPVSDYDKKLDHYRAFQASQARGVRKVA